MKDPIVKPLFQTHVPLIHVSTVCSCNRFGCVIRGLYLPVSQEAPVFVHLHLPTGLWTRLFVNALQNTLDPHAQYQTEMCVDQLSASMAVSVKLTGHAPVPLAILYV